MEKKCSIILVIEASFYWRLFRCFTLPRSNGGHAVGDPSFRILQRPAEGVQHLVDFGL
jgi:hypothetical protein